MGIFHNNKIGIKKVVDNDNIIFFLDCYNYKDLIKFKVNLMKELNKEKRYLAVVDTSLAYKNLKRKEEEEADELIKYLDEQGISYHKVVLKKDSQVSIMGMPMKLGKKDKVNYYVIGFLISPDQLEMVGRIADKYNTSYYAVLEDTDKEELLNEFDKSRGEKEELDQRFKYDVLYDDYMKIIRIRSNKDNMQYVEQIIKEQIDKIN